MLANTWKSATATTIHNCFRHAGLVPKGASSALDDDTANDQLSGNENLIDNHHTAGAKILTTISFSNFTNVDSLLKLCAELANKKIIRQMLAKCDSVESEDDDTPEAAQPMQAELMQAVATLFQPVVVP